MGFANFNPYSVELERHVESGRRPKCQFRMGLLSACQSVSEDKHGLATAAEKRIKLTGNCPKRRTDADEEQTMNEQPP